MHQKNNLHAQCSNLQNAGDRLSCSRCVFLLKRNSCQIQLPEAQLRDKSMCSNNPATLLKDSYTQGMLLVSYASHTRPKTDAARACRNARVWFCTQHTSKLLQDLGPPCASHPTACIPAQCRDSARNIRHNY